MNSTSENILEGIGAALGAIIGSVVLLLYIAAILVPVILFVCFCGSVVYNIYHALPLFDTGIMSYLLRSLLSLLA